MLGNVGVKWRRFFLQACKCCVRLNLCVIRRTLFCVTCSGDSLLMPIMSLSGLVVIVCLSGKVDPKRKKGRKKTPEISTLEALTNLPQFLKEKCLEFLDEVVNHDIYAAVYCTDCSNTLINNESIRYDKFVATVLPVFNKQTKIHLPTK